MWRIINPYKMARAVREHTVRYEEYAVYVLIFVVSSSIIIPPRHITPLVNPYIVDTIRVLTVFETFLSLIVAYIANKGRRGIDFWYRFISIYATMRIIILAIILISFSLFYISAPLSPSGPRYISWIPVIFYALYLTIFNIVIYRSMRIASSDHKDSVPASHDYNNKSFYLGGENALSKLINPHKMVSALQENRISKKEYALYIVILTIWSLSDVFNVVNTPSKDLYLRNTLHVFAVLGILTVLITAYRTNKRGDNIHFWYRFVSINIPLLITITVGSMSAVFLFMMIRFNLFWPSAINLSPDSWEAVPLLIASLLVHNILIYRYMRIASAPIAKQ